MKVAIISLRDSIGKTALASVLAGTFSRSHARHTCILSTGSAKDNTEIITVNVKPTDVSNLYVFKSMVDSSDKGDMELLNYGVKQGDEQVFIFDVNSTAMVQQDKEELFMSCMEKLPGDLTLIEIVGNYKSPFNAKVIECCDCALVLFDASPKGYELVKRFKTEAPQKLLDTCAYVCSRYNANVTSEKAISSETGIPNSNLFIFPENAVIGKLSVNGQLDRAAYNIIVADAEVVNMRMRLLQIMQFIFDSADRKVVRSLDKWLYK